MNINEVRMLCYAFLYLKTYKSVRLGRGHYLLQLCFVYGPQNGCLLPFIHIQSYAAVALPLEVVYCVMADWSSRMGTNISFTVQEDNALCHEYYVIQYLGVLHHIIVCEERKQPVIAQDHLQVGYRFKKENYCYFCTVMHIIEIYFGSADCYYIH